MNKKEVQFFAILILAASLVLLITVCHYIKYSDIQPRVVSCDTTSYNTVVYEYEISARYTGDGMFKTATGITYDTGSRFTHCKNDTVYVLTMSDLATNDYYEDDIVESCKMKRIQYNGKY